MTPEERAEIEAADLHSLQADAQHNADVWTLNRWRVQLLGALVEAEADRDRARDAAVALEQEVARVRELHRPIVKALDDDKATRITVCLECDALRESCSDEAEPEPYPCATIRALEGSEG